MSEINKNSQIENLHQKFVDFGKNAKEWKRKCLLLLTEIVKYRVWEKKNFGSVYEYAAKLAGISRSQLDESLRILRKIEDKPALKAVAEQKGLYAVRPVANIATAKTASFWAEKASGMAKNELEMFVREVRNKENEKLDSQIELELKQQRRILDLRDHENLAPESVQPQFKTIFMQLKTDVAAKLEKLNNSDWNQLMERFIDLYEKDLQTNKPQKLEKASRYILRKIKKHILKRSNGKCEFPNCNKPYKHLHHTERFALNKSHDPDKIVALCKTHHDLAHHGLIHNENQEIKFWSIDYQVNTFNPNRFVDEKVQFYRRISVHLYS